MAKIDCCVQISTLLLCNIMFGIVCRTAMAATVTDNEKTSFNDYDYDYGEDDSKADDAAEPTISNGNINANPPYFEKPEIEVEVTPGKSVLLKCDVRNFRNASNAIMWYKGTALISTGREPVSDRYESMENNALRIKSVQAADAGDYYCNVLPQQVKLHIQLRVGGLYIFCNGMDYTNRTMNTKQGASFNCECRTSAKENVELSWSLNGERADQIVTKVDRGQFWVDNVDAEHEGVYQCLADDKTSKPSIAALVVHVNYEPKISTHRHHVNAQAGDDAELYCDYKANPIGIVRWRKMGKELSYSEKYSIKNIMHQDARNRTILQVRNVNDDDLGEYECHVENSIGSNEVKVYLIYEPETPQFEDKEIKKNVVTLHWLVRSVQPLSEAVLDYMLLHTGRWSTVSVLHTRPHTENDMWKITHEMELMPGKWQARIKTRNTVGWSKFSAAHNFVITGDDDDDDNKMENNVNKDIPPEDIVMAAGVGIGKGKNATAMLVPSSIVIAISIFLLLLLNNNNKNNNNNKKW